MFFTIFNMFLTILKFAFNNFISCYMLEKF